MDKKDNNQTSFTLPPTRERCRALSVPRPANQQPVAPAIVALVRCSGKKRVWAGRERGIVAKKHRNNKELTSSPGCSSRTFANGPAATDNPGCSCIGLKTGRARTGCEHGSVKTKQAKSATHPLLCHQKTFPPVRIIWHQSLPSTQTNGRPQM